jgi:hypothetical protein
MFWQVVWYKYKKGEPPRHGKRRFGTKDAALEFHARLVEFFGAHGDSAAELFGLVNQGDDEDPEDHDEADWWKA